MLAAVGVHTLFLDFRRCAAPMELAILSDLQTHTFNCLFLSDRVCLSVFDVQVLSSQIPTPKIDFRKSVMFSPISCASISGVASKCIAWGREYTGALIFDTFPS